MLPSRIRRALVIEDDPDLREAVVRMLGGWGAAVSEAADLATARSALAEGPPPDLILIDVRLPDGPVGPLLQEIADLSPAPVVVAMSGVARPDEAFELGPLGVRAYLAKPFGRDELARSIETACGGTRPIQPVVRSLVGHVPMRDLQRQVRSVMVREALARTEGSRSGAARLLHVTRQAVQQIVRNDDVDDA